jgi:RimJ/RimL family protein N-acetyltransferase
MTADAPFPLLTPRLRLRRLVVGDAPFLHELYNDPDFLRNIGDRGIRTLDDARTFIARGPSAAYADVGYGMLCIEDAVTLQALGVCGLVRRRELPATDLGFALLPTARGRGVAREAAAAVAHFAHAHLSLPRLLGIALPSNHPSIRVLEAVGMRFERLLPWPADGSTLAVYALDF